MSLNLECPCSDQGRELSHAPGAWLLVAEALACVMIRNSRSYRIVPYLSSRAWLLAAEAHGVASAAKSHKV